MAILTKNGNVLLINGDPIIAPTGSGTINNRPIQTVTPTESQQIVGYSSPYTGLEGVIVQAIPYPNGDNIEYGTTELTDLTGTTWYFNETLSSDNADQVVYTVDLTCGNYSASSITIFSQSNSVVYGNYINAISALMYYAGEWASQNARTISITGGTDATNADLIAWIQANATEVTT